MRNRLENLWRIYRCLPPRTLTERNGNPMTNQTKQALGFLQQALNDYSGTLAPSVRGPFIAEASKALQVIDTALSEPDAK